MDQLKPCCFTGFRHEGQSKGQFKTVAGLETYITGEDSENVIVILTDIFGNKLNNTLLVADQLAEGTKTQVFIPDILKGDPIVDIGKVDKAKWFADHSAEETNSIITAFLKQLHSEKSPKKVFGVGYCFGAKFAILQLAKGGYFSAAAGAHPSLVTPEDVENIERPLLISVGDEDAMFTEELRNKTLSILNKKNVWFQMDIFKNAPHGYAVRGDVSAPSVKYAKEKTVLDQVYFFKSI